MLEGLGDKLPAMWVLSIRDRALREVIMYECFYSEELAMCLCILLESLPLS